MPRKKEVAFAISELGQLPPGRCNLKALYGSERQRTRRPRHFDVHDDVPAVRWVRQRSHRRQEAEVLPPVLGAIPAGRPLPSHQATNSASITSRLPTAA
jgi:hypothetical protein